VKAFVDIRDTVKTRLEAQDYLETITVLKDDGKSHDAREAALATGHCISILPSPGGSALIDAPGNSVMVEVTLAIFVEINPEANTEPLEDLMANVVDALVNYAPTDAHERFEFVKYDLDMSDAGTLGYMLYFTTHTVF
jgi:hypothetical protein